jgi:hypothetical protein
MTYSRLQLHLTCVLPCQSGNVEVHMGSGDNLKMHTNSHILTFFLEEFKELQHCIHLHAMVLT